MNKKGNIYVIIMMFFLLFLVLFLGFIMLIGSSVLNWVWDTAYPELRSIGTAGDSNFTKISEMTIQPVNTAIQSFTWLSGVLYVMMLVGSIAIAVITRANPSKWLIGFYLVMVIALIMGSILISNMYEEFYNDTGDLGDILREHTLLSFMVLHSPVVFTLITFITGIVLFSGLQEEEFV